MSDRLRTLFHPFEDGLLTPLAPGSRVLFLGAELGIPSEFAATDLTCIQGFRPLFRALQAEGRNVLPEPSGEHFDTAFVLAGRHRGQNETWIAEAIRRTVPGAVILVGGSKDDGATSLRKRMASHIELAGHLSKYHGVAFWFHRPQAPDPLLAALRSAALPALIDGRFHAAPGMFSHDAIDAGSRLLAEHLPANLKGHVADFCAGWGYLACDIAARCSNVRSIDLYEADFASLEAARVNTGANAPPMPGKFFWQDLVAESVAERYDIIVMNPPFHTGRAAEPGIGQSLIAAAGKALRKGGTLLIVANRQLPYEADLARHFARVEAVAQDKTFKVFRAIR